MSDTRPKHETTWNDYQERILRVLTHIQERLDEALDLEELAGVACFSSFHFHRVFAAMTGETIADHVRRLRLERAATELRSGAKQVIQVALDAGYEAHEAFTRAFRDQFGVTPETVRLRGHCNDLKLTEALKMSDAAQVKLDPPRLEHGRALLIAGS